MPVSDDRIKLIEKIVSGWGVCPKRCQEIQEEGVWKVTDDNSCFLLKQTSVTSQYQDYASFLGLLKTLQSRGAKIITPLPSKDGQYIRYKDEQAYQLFDYILHDEYVRGMTFSRDLLNDFGAALAEFHHACKDIPVDQDTDSISESTDSHMHFVCRNIDPRKAEELRTVIDHYDHQYPNVNSYLHEVQLTHRDCHPNNILWKGSEVVAFIDWTFAKCILSLRNRHRTVP